MTSLNNSTQTKHFVDSWTYKPWIGNCPISVKR